MPQFSYPGNTGLDLISICAKLVLGATLTKGSHWPHSRILSFSFNGPKGHTFSMCLCHFCKTPISNSFSQKWLWQKTPTSPKRILIWGGGVNVTALSRRCPPFWVFVERERSHFQCSYAIYAKHYTWFWVETNRDVNKNWIHTTIVKKCQVSRREWKLFELLTKSILKGFPSYKIWMHQIVDFFIWKEKKFEYLDDIEI